MKGDQPRLGENAVEQRGNIAVTEQHLGIVANALIVEQRQEARRAIATMQRKDRVHRLIGEHCIEVSSPFGVTPGQVTMPAVKVGTLLDLKTERCEHFHRHTHIIVIA